MAFGERRIFPVDLNTRRAVGINLPLNGDAVFDPNYTTKEAIKSNLINYLLTNPGERIANPLFGAGLREFIFTQIAKENLDFLKEDIQDKITAEFDDIQLDSIIITEEADYNTVKIQIDYSVPNTNINDNLILNFA
tara:strand:+ start:2123 stop:2530 length:408 start_codon:yes stop_codon:yes gene_type:complete